MNRRSWKSGTESDSAWKISLGAGGRSEYGTGRAARVLRAGRVLKHESGSPHEGFGFHRGLRDR